MAWGRNMAVRSEDFWDLVGTDLGDVTSVRDYLQLEFNPPPLLNAYTPVTVRSGGGVATPGEEAFANLLITQINKVVREVRLRPQEILEITFEDTSVILTSLHREHYVCAEAINLFRKDKEMIVI